MSNTDRLDECVAHRMGLATNLPPAERDRERRTLTTNVLMKVGESALQGDAAATKLLLDLGVLKLA